MELDDWFAIIGFGTTMVLVLFVVGLMTYTMVMGVPPCA